MNKLHHTHYLLINQVALNWIMRTWNKLMNMTLQWQVAMILMRMKKFYKKTGRKLYIDAKEPVGFDKTKVECYNCHKSGHFARECRIKGTQDNRRRDVWNSGNKDGSRTGQKEDSKALVTIDGEGVDWTNHSEDEDYALMACNSSDSDTEDYPHRALKNKGIVDSGCSRHMTGNKAYLAEFQDFNGGPVAFGGSKGYITGKGKIKTGKLDFENKPNVAGKGPTWLFDLDYLTDSMNYHPVRSENQANHLAGQQEANQNAGTKDIVDVGDSEIEDEFAQDCFVLPIWPSYSSKITPDLKTYEKRGGP
ncbi:ribonuclease H-like domain-containing protein, partial [Tanacetum coccineum]